MTVRNFEKLPSHIEAVQWDGTNSQELIDWTSGFQDLIEGQFASLYVAANEAWLQISVGTWIAKDQLGFYPIDNRVFGNSYPEVHVTCKMTSPEVMVAILKNDSEVEERPVYITKETFEPTEREKALLEDSHFMFLTKEHPENMVGRLQVTGMRADDSGPTSAKEMASVWRRAGDMHRFQIFHTLKS